MVESESFRKFVDAVRRMAGDEIFVKLYGEHIWANMAPCVASVLMEWNIDDKLLSVTCDSAENNSTLVGQLVIELPQSRISIDNKISCLAHTVQLIANSILSTVDTNHE